MTDITDEDIEQIDANNAVMSEASDIDDISDVQETTNPWDNAPENTIYYEKLYEDGHLGSITESAEMAYKFGWFDNQVAKDDVKQSETNGWTYLIDKCPVKSIDAYKTEKLKELSDIADKFEQNKCGIMYVVSKLGFRVNADRRSLQNVENLIAIGDATTTFKDYDNSFHDLSIEQLEIIADEIRKNGANLYTQKFRMQMQIAGLEMIENVKNFEIVFEMMDFTE